MNVLSVIALLGIMVLYAIIIYSDIGVLCKIFLYVLIGILATFMSKKINK